LLHCPGRAPAPALLGPIAARLAEVVSMQRLHGTVDRLEQSEKLQRSLYAIADLASSDLDMPDMLRSLHRIVSGLMYAENFYIVRYNAATDTMRFLYFVDTVETNPPPDEEIPLAQLEHGLTWYVLRDAQPMMGSNEELARQASGPVHFRGEDSKDWLGVPMMREGEVRGAMVVQTYLEDVHYTRAEMSLLAFVAEHVLTALERKQQHEELEHRVRDRTAQLARANIDLRREVGERERGERLQAALYRLAALASEEQSSERFYQHVHDIVGELIYSRNFYIALISEDGGTVSFPYAVDEQERDWNPRFAGRGLTEYVVRTGKPQLVDLDRAAHLIQAGEIAPGMVATPTRVWLGAPLFDSDRVIGVVAVQTYSPDVTYSERDAELLRFVSYQIASSLQRRRAAEMLVRANADLERRVEERTRELRAEISVREQIESLLKHQVMHDPLTGLPNRVYMRDRIERALASVRRDPDHQFGLLYIDVDRFKQINDSLGHLTGDLVLQEVAQRLGKAVREPDVVARLSGDEFAILLEHVQIPETATKVASRIISLMQRPIDVSGQSLQVGTSIGMAIGNPRYANVDEVLRDADAALYKAKSTGRNRLVLFDENLHEVAMNGLALEMDLRRALDAGEFLPHFQPVVRLRDQATLGYEALLRWQHPERGLLAPGEFLAAAEDSGLIEPIDWMLYRAAMQQVRSFIGDGFLAINLSARLFQRGDLDQKLLALAAETGFDPTRLRIEVTERTLLGDSPTVAAVLDRLREACVETVLDDFGTGQASLGQVQRFPLKTIKIDRSFVDAIGNDNSNRSHAVIAAILALARSLGLEVVAEGVETEKQRSTLVEMGCACGQGFLFAKPQPAHYWQRR
jgi:diguanylate cyclase (GGDEF)-like protein